MPKAKPRRTQNYGKAVCEYAKCQRRGKPFIKTKPWQKFCHPTHRYLAWYAEVTAALREKRDRDQRQTHPTRKSK